MTNLNRVEENLRKVPRVAVEVIDESEFLTDGVYVFLRDLDYRPAPAQRRIGLIQRPSVFIRRVIGVRRRCILIIIL